MHNEIWGLVSLQETRQEICLEISGWETVTFAKQQTDKLFSYHLTIICLLSCVLEEQFSCLYRENISYPKKLQF